MIISIDGKAKAGKSTLISDLVRKTGWPVYYAGDMYRSIVSAASENQGKNLSDIVDGFCNSFVFTGKPIDIKRDAETDLKAAQLNKDPEILTKLENLQKKIIAEHIEQGKNLILDGGYGKHFNSPEFMCFFVTASDETRLNRFRCDKYGFVGRTSLTFKYEESKEQLDKRDNTDLEFAPWRYIPVEGAVVIDTTNTPYGHSYEIVLSAVTNRLNELSLPYEFKDNKLSILPKAQNKNAKFKSDQGKSPTCDCG